MGARYVARAVPAGMVAIAKIHPGAFFNDPCFRLSCLATGRRPDHADRGELHLGEAWADLQLLLLGQGDDPPRPACELVTGRPRFAGMVLLPCVRLLDPDQVAAVAGDLASLDMDALYQDCLPHHSPDWAAILAGRREDVVAHLAAATSFTALLTCKGMGMIYSIG